MAFLACFSFIVYLPQLRVETKRMCFEVVFLNADFLIDRKGRFVLARLQLFISIIRRSNVGQIHPIKCVNRVAVKRMPAQTFVLNAALPYPFWLLGFMRIYRKVQTAKCKS